MTISNKFQTFSLFALALLYLTMLGGGTYEQMNVTRVVASSPPESLYMLKGDFRFSPILFWATLRPLTILSFIVTIAQHFRGPADVRRLLLVAFAVDVAITAWTFLYFAPETAAIVDYGKNGVGESQLTERIHFWYSLNYFRLLGLYVVGVCLLIAVFRTGTSYQKVSA